MRVAVSKFVGLHEKEPTKALLELRGYYGFSHRFCNTYRANEKGHVERSVEYVRRKAFALRDSFENIQDAQAWLMDIPVIWVLRQIWCKITTLKPPYKNTVILLIFR